MGIGVGKAETTTIRHSSHQQRKRAMQVKAVNGRTNNSNSFESDDSDNWQARSLFSSYVVATFVLVRSWRGILHDSTGTTLTSDSVPLRVAASESTCLAVSPTFCCPRQEAPKPYVFKSSERCHCLTDSRGSARGIFSDSIGNSSFQKFISIRITIGDHSPSWNNCYPSFSHLS